VIARYAPWVDHSLTAIMRAVESGEWVKYAEVLAMEARVTIAEDAIEKIRVVCSGESVPIPKDAMVLPGRFSHADWCPAIHAPSCICGANEAAFDAFNQPRPERPVA
jgi:hypothetical protein